MERVSVEIPPTCSAPRGRLGRPFTARATWLSSIMSRLLGLRLSTDLAVVVIDVRQREIEVLRGELLDGLEDFQGQIRREVESAVEMSATDHPFFPPPRPLPGPAGSSRGRPSPSAPCFAGSPAVVAYFFASSPRISRAVWRSSNPIVRSLKI